MNRPKYKILHAMIAGIAMTAACAASARGDAISDSINAGATGLVNTQNGSGGWSGPFATGYFGTVVDGLIDAYGNTGSASYKTAAISGGNAIVTVVNGSSRNGFMEGDEAYALARASALPGNASSATQLATLNNFFNSYVPTNFPSTSSNTSATNLANYMASSGDHTTATIYMSYFTMAAYATGRSDAGQYRAALIDQLNQVTDYTDTGNQQLPVQALGAATWALAQTGNGLSSSTILTGSGNAYDVFGGSDLSQLPFLLSECINGSTNTANYLLTYNGYYGFTDDTAMAIMGLAAADAAEGNSTYSSQIAALRLSLATVVNTGTDVTSEWVTGTTANTLAPTNNTGQYYAGRALEGLATPGVEISPAPEPASLGVLAAGLVVVMAARRRKSA